MSKTIDEKVVSMQFDNAQFEKNVSTSIKTVDNLKKSLNLEGASKGLENVNNAAKHFDMSALSNGVETIKTKFSALQVMAVTALANITNSAVNAGKNLVKAFTIDPIKTGFSEYETQINAVQTILANTESKGSTLQDVNRALDELNTYADKTIYNFTEMTRNIGTFTAAGVDLNTSVSAIQGIANLAAVSGSTSQQASTAMYQLSQALATGTVKLMDWNSVVNAGMGGQVFQDALKQTARAHGVAVDSIIEKQGSFRESLSEGWLTTDILTETLNQFTMAAEEGSEEWENYKKSLMETGYTEAQAESILKMANTATDAATKVKTFSQLMDTLKESAQSGWTQSWEIMMGDFEEAKGFLTDVSDRLGAMIGESADARNKMLSEGLSSGWKQLLDAGIADEEGYKETFKEVAKVHGTSVDDMIAAEKKLDSSLSDSEAFQKALKTGFKDGSLSADMLSESVHKMADKMSNMSAKELEAAGYTQEHVKQIKDLSAGLKDGSVSMDDFVKKINRPSGRENIIQALWNAFDGLMSVITPIKEAFREIFPATTGEQLYRFTERIRDFTAKLKLSDDQSAKLKSTFKGLFSIVKIGITAIKVVVSGIGKLIGKFSGLGGGILDITSSLGNWISGIADSVAETNMFGKAIDGVVGFLGKGINKIKEFASFIKGKFEAPGFETFLNILKTIGNAIKKVGLAVVKVASSIGKALGNAFRNGDMKSLLDLVNGGIVTAILLKLKSWISGFKDLAGEGKSFVDSIKEVLGTVGDSLQAWQQNLKAGTLQKIAIAIGILAASLWVLSGIDPEKLGSALGAITVLFIELIAAMKAFDKLGINTKGSSKAAILMIGMSVAVLILASALKKIADLDWEAMAKGLIAVGVLLGELVGAAKLMSLGGKNISKGATQMILMAVALKIMASVCEDLSKLGWEELGKGIAGIGGILLIFAGFAELIKLIKPKNMMSSALSLVIIGAAMEIFADVCKKFGGMEWPELGKAGAAIGGILVLAAGFGKLASYASKMVKSSIAVILIGAAMEIFADVCKKFGQMEWGALAKAGAAIGGILALAAGFVLLSGLSKKMMSSVIALTIIGVAMEIFADVCKKFGQMEWSALGKAGAAIGGILVLAAGFALLAGMAGNMLLSAASLLVMAVALKALTPVLTTLGDMSWGSIAKGLVAIAAALGLLLGAAALAIYAGLGIGLLAIAGSVILLGIGCLAAGVGITAFAIGLGMLAGVTAAGATAIVAALHIIIVGILDLIPAILDSLTRAVVALCQVFIQCVPAICEAIRVLVVEIIKVLVECIPVIVDGVLKLVTSVLEALVAYVPQIVDLIFDFFIAILDGIARKLPSLIQSVVNVFKALFSGVVDALSSMDPEILVKGILGIGFMLAMMMALAAMAALTPAAMVGVIGFGAVITELAGVLAILGGLAQIPGLDWLVSEGGDFLQTVGTAIGQFIGGIAGGIAEGVTSMLPQVGINLSEFMANIQPFIDGAKMIDTSTFEGVQALVDIVLLLTGANILEGLTSWFTGGSSLTKFGEEIAAFAPSIKTYADTVKGIDASAVEASVNAARCISELANNLPNSGGVAGFFAGENDIGTFGEQLVPFGEGMKSYSDAITGFNAEAVIASASAAKAIAEMTATIPNQGGVVAWFAGENSIANFAFDLVKLGEGLKSYSDAITGFNAEAAMASANAAKAIAEMTATIPNQGGVVAWFAGDNSIATFASQLPILGAGLLNFSMSVSGINIENIMAATSAAKALADMASVIPNEGGMVAWFTGDNSIATFASQLPTLGAGLKGFADSVAGIVPENVTAAADAAKKLGEMMSVLPENIDRIKSFGNKLENFGEKLSAYFSKTSGISGESIDASNKAIQTLTDISSKVDPSKIESASKAIEKMADALKDASKIKSGSTDGFSKALNNIAKNSADAIIKSFKDMHSKVNSAGKTLMNKFIDGMKAKKSDVKKAGKELVSKASSAIKSQEQYNKFKSAGKYLGDGLVEGINSKKQAAYDAGYALGQKAVQGEKDGQKSESPSKLTIKAGKWLGEGLVIGMRKMSNQVYRSGYNLGETATDTISSAISKIADTVNSDIDTQPTIRPVVDMSDVTDSANSINSMFRLQPSIGVLSKVRSIGSMMNESQNGRNSEDVVSAINDLRKDISGLPRDTYNINGITYDDGSNVSDAVRTLVRAAKIERRT